MKTIIKVYSIDGETLQLDIFMNDEFKINTKGNRIIIKPFPDDKNMVEIWDDEERTKIFGVDDIVMMTKNLKSDGVTITAKRR